MIITCSGRHRSFDDYPRNAFCRRTLNNQHSSGYIYIYIYIYIYPCESQNALKAIAPNSQPYTRRSCKVPLHSPPRCIYPPSNAEIQPIGVLNAAWPVSQRSQLRHRSILRGFSFFSSPVACEKEGRGRLPFTKAVPLRLENLNL